MKKTLFICCMLAAALCQANAQVSKSDFNTKCNALDDALEKGSHDHAVLDSAFSRVSRMMSTEIAYRTRLVSDSSVYRVTFFMIQNKAITDSIKASDDYKTAFAERANTTQTKYQRLHDIKVAQKEVDDAHSELRCVPEELKKIKNNLGNLATERKIFAEFQPLHAPTWGPPAIIRDYILQFEATIDEPCSGKLMGRVR